MTLAATLEAPRKARKLRAVPDETIPPRIAPPLPARSEVAKLRELATLFGRPLYPWQDIAGQYMTATALDGRWLYPELVIVVARQNGKTSLLTPRIVMGLLRGERIMMTAQDRQLIVRDVFADVSDMMEDHFRSQMKERPRRANGQETVSMLNGGKFRIVAPTRNGARGPANDLVILDEAREMRDTDFVAAAQPTLTVSPRPQFIYLSNAGTDESVVLNGLRKRAESDPTLGYVEWSAHPDRQLDDRAGWREANPALAGGRFAAAHWDFLERMFRSYTEVEPPTPAIFDTEHLCRWHGTEAPHVISADTWSRLRKDVGMPVPPVSMGIAQDPGSRRISAVIAWPVGDAVHMHLLADVEGDPVDMARASEALRPHIRRLGIRDVCHDPWTDADLARHMPESKPIYRAYWESACGKFAQYAEAGRLVCADEDGKMAADLPRTVRLSTSHGWEAVRSGDEPATSILAAIRAVWLATKPAPPRPKVH